MPPKRPPSSVRPLELPLSHYQMMQKRRTKLNDPHTWNARREHKKRVFVRPPIILPSDIEAHRLEVEKRARYDAELARIPLKHKAAAMELLDRLYYPKRERSPQHPEVKRTQKETRAKWSDQRKEETRIRERDRQRKRHADARSTYDHVARATGKPTLAELQAHGLAIKARVKALQRAKRLAALYRRAGVDAEERANRGLDE